MSKANAKIPVGLRWFYCVGFGTALACMSRSICYKTSIQNRLTSFQAPFPCAISIKTPKDFVSVFASVTE